MPPEAYKAFQVLQTILFSISQLSSAEAALHSHHWWLSRGPQEAGGGGGGGTGPSWLKSNQVVNFKSPATLGENRNVTSKNMLHFSWKCQLQFGPWNITLCIYEENTLFCILTTNLLLTWALFIPRPWTECKKPWTRITLRQSVKKVMPII